MTIEFPFATGHKAAERQVAFLPGPIISAEAAVQTVRRLTPDIEKRADQIERDRLVSVETIDALSQAGLFGIIGAKAFGGSQVGLEALVKVTIEIASACGSSGWVYGVLAGHSWMLNLFSPQAQQEVAESPNPLASTVFRLGGDTVPVDGGYELTGGQGRFCSGIDHAAWVIIGNSVRRGDGPPEARFSLVPRSEVEIIDDWNTLGMRGTGSRSIRIAKAFIPEHRSVSMADIVAGTAPGVVFHDRPFYRLPFTAVTPYSIVGAPLGMARAALRMFSEDLKKNGPGATVSDSILMRLGRASVMIDSAIDTVLADAARLDRIVDPAELTELDRQTLRRNWCWAVQSCRSAVASLYEAAGGSAIYDSSRFQRVWRDINSAAQHIAFTEDAAMLDYARAKLGIAIEAFAISKPTNGPTAAKPQ